MMSTRLSLLALAAFAIGCASDDDPTTPDPMDDDPMETFDIVDIASADADFSTLAGAIVDAGLEETLRSTGPFTVFAPTNAAFEALGIDLSTLSADELSTILEYHVVAAEVPASAVPERADSANGYTIFFDTSNGVGINGSATVTTADVDAENGLIHMIDTVLLPPTILDAVGYAGLTELGGAVGAADPSIAELLAAPAEHTVFAPTNEAFTAIADITATLDTAGLSDVLTYHVVAGSVDSGMVPGQADTLLINAWGNGVTALFDTSVGVTVNGSSDVAIADIRTTNGIIHVVDEVLLPPTVVGHADIAGLTGLLGAVDAASGDLGTVLSGEGPFTVFAPTNDAFDDIAAVTATLSADDLADVLLYHVVGGASPVASTDLSDGMVPTLLGSDVEVDLSSGVMINDSAVIQADIHSTNGVVHVIDAVLLP